MENSGTTLKISTERENLQYKATRALIFVNHEIKEGYWSPEDRAAADLIKTCISDLMKYGEELAKIELVARRKSKTRIAVEQLMSFPQVRELNQRFNDAHFDKAADLVLKKGELVFEGMDLTAPAFFRYRVAMSGPIGIQRLFDFLEICSHVDPRHWQICKRCDATFLTKRLRDDTRFCSKECRYAFHNDTATARERKNSLAKRERAKGNGKYIR